MGILVLSEPDAKPGSVEDAAAEEDAAADCVGSFVTMKTVVHGNLRQCVSAHNPHRRVI